MDNVGKTMSQTTHPMTMVFGGWFIGYVLATGHRNFMGKKIGILGDILEIFNQQWGTWV